MWECRCDCGALGRAKASDLVAGLSVRCKSCAQLVRNAAAGNNKSKHPLYVTWRDMIIRCTKPFATQYKYYGGRGIQVCSRWLSFENFLADMVDRPSPQHSLDRFPNRDGNYEPGNVRWATAIEQGRNTRANLVLEYRGEALCASEWAARFGLVPGALYKRLELGWSVERALTTPSGAANPLTVPTIK